MPIWYKRFQMKDLLRQTDVSPAEATELGKQVSVRLRKSRPLTEPRNTRLASRFSSVSSQARFNRVLAELYDAADDERVWIH